LLFPEQTLSSRWTVITPRKIQLLRHLRATTREVGGSYRLYVDDKLVLDNWTTLSALADYRTLRLDPQPHKIVLEQPRRALDGLLARMGIVRDGQFVSANAKKPAATSDVVVVCAGFDSDPKLKARTGLFACRWARTS